jgi:hypothetical protein
VALIGPCGFCLDIYTVFTVKIGLRKNIIIKQIAWTMLFLSGCFMPDKSGHQSLQMLRNPQLNLLSKVRIDLAAQVKLGSRKA